MILGTYQQGAQMMERKRSMLTGILGTGSEEGVCDCAVPFQSGIKQPECT